MAHTIISFKNFNLFGNLIGYLDKLMGINTCYHQKNYYKKGGDYYNIKDIYYTYINGSVGGMVHHQINLYLKNAKYSYNDYHKMVHHFNTKFSYLS